MPIISYPTDCLNAVHSCLELSFAFDFREIQDAPGSPASVAILLSVFNTLQDGSTITINGVTFFFVTGTPLVDSNEIQIGATVEITAANIEDVINGNYSLFDKFTFNTTAFVFTMSAIECGYCIDIQIRNTTTNPVAFVNNGTAIRLKEDVRVSVNLICSISGNEIEIDIPAKVNLSNDGCTVIDGNAKKDISKILRGCVKTPLPDCSVDLLPKIFDRNEMMELITVAYTSASGNPLNFFDRLTEDKAFLIYNGLYQDNDVDRLTEYCSATPKPLTINQDITSVGCGQCMPVYLKLQDSTSHDIQISVCIYDSAGVLIGTVPYTSLGNPAPVIDDVGGIIEVQTGLPQLAELIAVLGIAVEDVISFTVKLKDVTDTGDVIYSELERVVKCCEGGEEFFYLTSLGTYETILTDEIINSTKTVEQKFIDQCTPCQPGTTDRGLTTTESSSFRTFNTYLKSKMEYSQNVLDEFLSSTEIYWCVNGELYWVQPTTSSYQDYSKNGAVDIPFSFRMFAHKSFSQVCK